MKNKAILLRGVSAIATAAASTAGGMQHATAQSLAPGAEGYYYSVSGGLMFSSSERYLSAIEDKVGYTAGVNSSGSSFYNSGNYSSGGWWSGYGGTDHDDLDDFRGLFGSVSFGKQLDPSWDIRGTLSVVNGGSVSGYAEAWAGYSSFNYWSGGGSGSSGFSGSSWTRSYGDAWADGTYKFGYASADFEVGYTPVLGDNLNVRLFAGVRALSFKSTFEGQAGGSGFYQSGYEQSGPGSDYYSSYTSSFYDYYFDGKVKAEFTGIGPRIGAQASTRFEGTNFGVSGSVAASVLFGKQKVTRSGYSSSYNRNFSSLSSYNSGSPVSGSSLTVTSGSSFSSYTSEASKTVVDLQASVGLDYYLNDNTALTVGYQAEKLFEVGADSSFNSLNPGAEIDTLSHGAFIKLSGTF